MTCSLTKVRGRRQRDAALWVPVVVSGSRHTIYEREVWRQLCGGGTVQSFFLFALKIVIDKLALGDIILLPASCCFPSVTGRSCCGRTPANVDKGS